MDRARRKIVDGVDIGQRVCQRDACAIKTGQRVQQRVFRGPTGIREQFARHPRPGQPNAPETAIRGRPQHCVVMFQGPEGVRDVRCSDAGYVAANQQDRSGHRVT